MKINNTKQFSYKNHQITFSRNTENVIYSPQKTKKDTFKSATNEKISTFWTDIKEFFETLFDKETITYNSSKRKKIKVLTESDIPYGNAKQIANMGRKDFENVLDFIMYGMDATCSEDIPTLNEEQLKQAKDILQYKEITDKDLIRLSRLKKEKFEEACNLLDCGVEKESVVVYSNCTKKERRDIKSLLDKGYKPQEAILLRKRPFSEEARTFFKELLETGLPTANVESLIKQPELHEKTIKLFQEGINEDLLEDFAKLTPQEEERCKELRAIGLEDIDVIELCTLSDNEYKQAKELIGENVHTNFVLPLIYIENNESENKEYKSLLKRGIGKNSAFSISCFSTDEKEIFKNFIKTQPIVHNYLKNNYEVNCIGLQQQETDEITFTKKFYNNGAQIILTDTLKSNGELKQYRSEKYQDGSISESIKSGKKSVLITRDKKKTITSITEYLKDRTGSVYGVLHSEKSKELLGAFNTTYYDISDFMSSADAEKINNDIKSSIKEKGTELSKVTKNLDGSIEYNEIFSLNEYQTKRFYKENKNGSKKEYIYTITNKNGEEILSINNYWKKNADNTVTNIINGNKYLISYDDNEKEITIKSEQGKKTISLYSKLAKYPQERLWKIAKGLDAERLIKIDNEVGKWRYCRDVDSTYTKFQSILTSGDNTDIISHEMGHINAYNLQESDKLTELKESYLKEMKIFEERSTFAEQEIIEYLSPRAENEETDGFNEFIAEANMLFHSFGNKTTIRNLGLRSQILAKYFPETLAKIAEATGKNSKEPLI